MVAQTASRRSRTLSIAVEPAEAQLRVPPLRSGVVGRTGLVNRLRTQAAPVVVVTAPAGYGKTTVLGQWAERDPHPFVWVGLGPGDGTSAALPRLVSAAALRRFPDDAELRRLDQASGVPGPSFQRRFARWLLDRDRGLVLVLDGAEHLADRAAPVVELLADHLPHGAHLVLAGRGMPALPLGRFRAEGRLLEISAADLRLSDREAAVLLREAGVGAEPAEVAELNRRAEGWPAGLALAALALRPPGIRVRRPPASLSGAHAYLAEYFASEVLAGLRDEDAAFCVESSLLDTLSGPACDAVLAVDGSGRRLRRLAARGAFLVPLDPEATTFRLHGFFRDVLRSRLEQESPRTFETLSRRAADWYAERGDVPRAIEHLRAVGDRRQAARLLGTLTPAICMGAVLDAVVPSVDALHDEQTLLEHQSAAIAGALVHALRGDVADLRRWAVIADAAPARTGLADGTASSEGWAHALRAAVCRDGLTAMREEAALAVQQVAPTSPVGALSLLLVAVADLLAGANAEAETVLAEAADAANAAEAPLVESIALAEQSLLAQESEEWRRAESLASRARDLADALDADHVGAAPALVASARSALRASNWVRAGDDIERVQRLLPRATGAIPWLAVQVRLELARALLALNDVGGADELVAEAEHLLLERPHLGRLETLARELRARIDGVRRTAAPGAAALTAAELRLLPYLTTHLTFRQIAEHLYVSRNTVKTQAISVYRKLDVTSRTEAIDRAVELGLLRPEGEILEHLA